MSKSTTKSAKVSKATSKAKAAKAVSGNGNGNNPYRVGGGYWAAVEALRSLGVNKMHGHDAILPAVKKAMGDGWKAFADKDGKLTADERAMLNVSVTARKDYGEPLHKIGWEVRWDGRAKTAGLFKVGHK